MFNNKKRRIEAQSKMISSLRGEIGYLEEKLKNSQCYANDLTNEVNSLKLGTANMSKLISDYYNENCELKEAKLKCSLDLIDLQKLHDSLKYEYKLVEDWANSRPVFVE